LKEKFSENKNTEIVHGDALKILPTLISQFPNFPVSNYKFVGNIPFYISGRLMRTISELKIKPDLAVFVIQKEVGQRICAKPPQMNLLAASVQFWAEPKIIGYISKKEFKPEPEVDAAIIKLETKKLRNQEIIQMPDYYRLIGIIFKQPRKTILNNVMTSDVRRTSDVQKLKREIVENLAKFGVNPQDRPQNLSIEQIKQLSTLF